VKTATGGFLYRKKNMGYQEFTFQLPTDYGTDDIKRRLERELQTKDFSFTIDLKSLDARQRKNIHWLVKLGVSSPAISGGEAPQTPQLTIVHKERKEKAVVVGSGPAGFFAAFILQQAGIKTTLIERGSKVSERCLHIENFEKTGEFHASNNYAFGEGGAGTFSDGKLTSRTKGIKREKDFMIERYIEAGAPEEIRYMAHPHIGSDILRPVTERLREIFIERGGRILFDTMLTDLRVHEGRVVLCETSDEELETDYCVIAPGHSAYETYRMLMKRGVAFRAKNFAIGTRVEHSQMVINRAQWGRETLPGLKSAEYRLTSPGDGKLPVYTFCMCPGGTVVPSAVYPRTNIVNGMSLYARDGVFANAACVAGVNLNELFKRELAPEEVLDWLEALEESFYSSVGNYSAPFCTIQDFLKKKNSVQNTDSSFPLGITARPLWEMLPREVSHALTKGLYDFSQKLRGFESGIMLGLESKTSSPIQALRDRVGLCTGFKNLYLVGEGSGYAGGIISSGVDGIRAALSIIES
jgi:uncharacterized FAD-dependent dehydrogenase